MASATEQITLELVVDASQANRAIDQTRSRVLSFDDGVARLRNGAGRLDDSMGKIERSARGVGQAVGGMNSAVDNSVGAVGDLAMVLASGGVFGVAMTAAAIATSKLLDYFKELNEQIDKQDKAWADFVAPLTKARDEMRKTAQDGVRELQVEFANLNATLEQTEFNKIAFKVSDLMTKIIDNEQKLKTASAETAEQLRLENSTYRQQINDLNNATQQRARLVTSIDAHKRKVEEQAAAEAAAAKRAEEAARLRQRAADESIRAKEREAAETKRIDEQMVRDEEEMQATLLRMGENDARRTEALQQKQYDAEKALQEQRLRETTASWASVYSVGANAMQMLTDAVIKGQEDAFAVVASYLMRQAGQAMVAYGTESAAAGTAMLLTSGGINPQGYVALAGGLAMITGGVALGGIATGLEVFTANAAAGNAESSAAQRAQEEQRRKTEMESSSSVARRSTPSRNSDATGGVTIINNYGLGVPMEKAGRDLEQLLAYMRRNGMRGAA